MEWKQDGRASFVFTYNTNLMSLSCRFSNRNLNTKPCTMIDGKVGVVRFIAHLLLLKNNSVMYPSTQFCNNTRRDALINVALPLLAIVDDASVVFICSGNCFVLSVFHQNCFRTVGTRKAAAVFCLFRGGVRE